MGKIVYVTEYDNGWDVLAIPVRSAWRSGSRSIVLNGEFYWHDQLFRSSEAAWKYIHKEYVPDSERYSPEELLN